jgi:hypothetical protein
MTPQQLAYIGRRRRQMRYWPFMAVMLTVVLAGCYAFLFIKAPVYVSPFSFVEQLRAHKIGNDQLATLAALGNLAFIACGFFILALIALTSLSMWNEHRLIQMMDLPAAPPASGLLEEAVLAEVAAEAGAGPDAAGSSDPGIAGEDTDSNSPERHG